MIDERTIESTVKAILVDVLAVDEREVTPAARFFVDLPGESIELLELGFQIKKRLCIDIDFNRIFAGDLVRTDASGAVTPDSRARLAAEFPFLPIDRLPRNATPQVLVHELLTVAAIVSLVIRQSHRAGAAQATPPRIA